jgi:hypothetical protein
VATTQSSTLFLDEVVELLTTGPSPEELLNYRPSEQVQQRARELLTKLNSGETTPDEERELDQFQFVESLMRLINARIHAKKGRAT